MSPSSLGAAASALALGLLPLAASAEGSLRCDGGIVSVGDSKLDLVGKCGWPALQENSGERAVVFHEQRGPAAVQRTVTAATERWTYDFGSSRFIQIVVLELGRIVRIERGGYGYGASALPAPPLPRARCAPTAFHLGDSSYEVLARCGEPTFREVRVDAQVPVVTEGAPARVDAATVTVEVWTYDFGPSAFVRHLTFEDGRLARIETGSYGYAR